MKYMFDTANLNEIEKYMKIYPICGVTTNPSILKAEGKVGFYSHLKAMRKLIGNRSLHVQTISADAAAMVKEAEAIVNGVDRDVFIKIPTTEEGLMAMGQLKAMGIGVTATAVYSQVQGFMAIAAGADYVAPYCNRMENLDADPYEAIAAMRYMIEEEESSAQILAASFKNIGQVNRAFLSGAHTATVQPALLHSTFQMAAIHKAVDDFKADWVAVRGDVSLADLTE
ncbi:MAG: fructose-6-phosphate aldolase [Clostridiales bacterium]|nr:fructose-6-phosphate aldolase [Clostridiales bacterium]